MSTRSSSAIAEELGQRLKQARLNRDYTQEQVAERAGVSRKAVVNAEKGKAQLVVFVAILDALELTEHLDRFLPPQPLSPIQLAKLQGKQRQRASGLRARSGSATSSTENEDTPEW
ncbi:helix-turn-helix transcriptional regulator [Aliidiomarina halalkaliphila]|uniref:Helix-turn-helix transcriptional regulator n=1 Tax=Aliidiomarina halalkaliphila TaxID=2593535 RepID=A0A552WZZ5_9GAMM|nr:helix-turn-helix transcriptional regulator [Aliidiomarina halalkaliphila]TRW48387.1 helix-turn-helix transcriptional regulator [Aliidiomarina halalkaliphila]